MHLVVALPVGIVLIAGCASLGPVPEHVAPVADPEVAAADGPPPLEVFTSWPLSDGRLMRVRGSVRNSLGETVTGVRVVLRIYSRDGDDALERERFQKDLDVTLARGETAGLRWDVESLYVGAPGFDYQVLAYPKRIGTQEVRPPPGWE